MAVQDIRGIILSFKVKFQNGSVNRNQNLLLGLIYVEKVKMAQEAWGALHGLTGSRGDEHLIFDVLPGVDFLIKEAPLVYYLPELLYAGLAAKFLKGWHVDIVDVNNQFLVGRGEQGEHPVLPQGLQFGVYHVPYLLALGFRGEPFDYLQNFFIGLIQNIFDYDCLPRSGFPNQEDRMFGLNGELNKI